MNRYDAYEFHNYMNARFIEDEDCLYVDSQEVTVLIDKIYDDIESRVCDNCKHNQYANGLKYCYELDEYDMKYCDRFEVESK